MNHNQLLEIGIKKRNKEIDLSWQRIAEKYGGELFTDGETLRCWVKNQVYNIAPKKSRNTVNTKTNSSYKESFEINKDGSQSSSKLIQLSTEQKKSPKYLLEAHGFDPAHWELINAKASEWTGYSKQDGQFPQYASKITVRPLHNKINFDKLIEVIKESTSPVEAFTSFTHLDDNDKKMLEIPLFDTHFGVSDYQYYSPTQQRILDKIKQHKWEEIVFIIGQDMIHNDDFRGRTASGTQIEPVDIEKAWEDCKKFYEPLIDESFKQSNRVKVIYSKGNHDESISWAFVQMLKARFPRATFDDSFIERKIHVFGDNFIGITHGDKAKKNLHNIFPIEFPEMWAKAKNREIHTGHLHTEDSKDWYGMMVRTLATRNKTDKWHQDQGFVGGHKRFMLFEYDLQNLVSIHYV
ncbi:hypothetical protein [Paenibacillus dendritiformis]|uniref:hypothetical protein n=1 Tax=Paenibacillus dendritiformis TaxID=130049 RepID=UPI00387E1B69